MHIASAASRLTLSQLAPGVLQSEIRAMSVECDRLGGITGQMFLRFIGWDGFVTSRDVVTCLRDAGLDIAEEVKSKRDLGRVQAQFNVWAKESGLPYRHISRICALSIGENAVFTADA